MDNKSEIVSNLVHEGQELFQKPKANIAKFVRNPKYLNGNKADRLLNDFENYPHAFVIGCIADKQVDADIAWLTPYNIFKQVESFKLSDLSKFELPIFKEFLANCNPKHRFHKMLAEEIYYGIQHIEEKYDGNAQNIWAGNPSCSLVAKRFSAFKGIGPKISSMATNILAREFKVPFSNFAFIDISADVHIKRVFSRLGLCNESSTEDEVIKIARKLHPNFPGLMDLPTWEIGRNFCHSTNPNCNMCHMKLLCEYSNS